MRNYLKVIILCIVIACPGCYSSYRNSNDAYKENQQAPVSKNKFNPIFESTPDGLRKAWQDFIADGRYRLAQAEEFDLPSSEKPWPCHYGWSGELFAIVIDTAQSGGPRFRLILFKPPKDKAERYELHWIKHNHDLSRTILSNASSDLVAYEYDKSGGRRNSTLKWDKDKKVYTCLVPSIS